MFLLKLDNLISYYPQSELKFKTFQFNGGEQHIIIENDEDFSDSEVTIEASITDSNKLMLVFLATDALRRIGFKKINLFAPYLPYARQDRVCNYRESLSIKVICDLINTQNYDTVYTLDNHSEVSTALLNNYKPINLEKILIRTFVDFDECVFVSPDAGALKKVNNLAQYFGGIPVIECGKKRNTKDGKILKTVVYSTDIWEHTRLIIIDDICDGGRTFIELAKVLKTMGGSNTIELFVSHGIFSQGLEVFDDLISDIYTTKSFKNNITDKIGEGFRYDDM